MGKSVGSVFHSLGNSALAPKAGHRPAPGPAPHAPGAPLQLGLKGAPTAPYGHPPSFYPSGRQPQQPLGGMPPGPF